MSVEIHTKGLDELTRRMSEYPDKLDRGMKETTDATLLTLWENVPSYPSPPADSEYRRTGTLGRSLGGGEGGGRSGGQPDIYATTKIGGGWEGRFGTRTNYAPYVIGDSTQAWVHKGRWWVMSDIVKAAQPKIEKLWSALASAMKDFLERQ